MLPRYSTAGPATRRRAPLHLLTHALHHLPRRVTLFRDFLAEGLSTDDNYIAPFVGTHQKDRATSSIAARVASPSR